MRHNIISLAKFHFIFFSFPPELQRAPIKELLRIILRCFFFSGVSTMDLVLVGRGYFFFFCYLLLVEREENETLRNREKDAAELRSLLDQKRGVSTQLARGAEAARARAEKAESEAEKMRAESVSLR